MFGGEIARGRSSDVLEYDSARKSFSTHTPLPEERCYAAATAIDNDRFLVVGGHTDTILFDKSCRVYDTRTRKWSKDWPDLNIGRRGHSCVTTNNKVYVIGGCGYKKVDSIEVLDLSESTPRWKHKRSFYAAATQARSLLLVA